MMVPIRFLTLFAVLTSVTFADEPPQPVQPIVPSPPYVPGAYATSRPVEDESTRMLKENPALVRELLKLSSEDAEEATITLYCLGPAAAKQLLAEIDADEPEVRQAAMSSLMFVCAHENAPRTEIVKAVLAKIEKADAEQATTLRQVLHFVVRSMRPEFRTTLRTSIDAGLLDDL